MQSQDKQMRLFDGIPGTDRRPYGRFPRYCEECREIEQKGSVGPSHNGSRLCKSRSIASGGNRAHCTCDTCF